MNFNRNRRFGPPGRGFNHGFFVDEAYRAGYFHPYFPGRDQIGSAPDEALRWEIERQRIRAEMIEADMARRRQIEEEVRRELAIEREIALQRARGLLDSATSAQEQIRLPNSPILAVRNEGRFSLGSRPSPEFGDSDVRQNPAPEDTEKSSAVVSIKPPSSVTVGEKRKEPLQSVSGDEAAEPEGNEPPWLAIPRKKTKTTQCLWVCTLCNVSCTSSDGLDDHRLGKKHMRNVSESEAKTREGGSGETDVKALQTNAEQSAGAPSSGNINEEESKTPPKTSGPKKKFKQSAVWRAPPENKVTKFSFWCEICGVQCNSATARDSHLGGKKHLRLSTNTGRRFKNRHNVKLNARKKNVHKNGGGANQSLEIDVKQPDPSRAESVAVVPKQDDGKENGGSNGSSSSGDVLDGGAFQSVEIEAKQPAKSVVESIALAPKEEDGQENGGSNGNIGDVLDGGAFQSVEIEVKQPDKSVVESISVAPKEEDGQENGGSNGGRGDVVDGGAIQSVQIEMKHEPDQLVVESIALPPKAEDGKEDGGSNGGNEGDLLSVCFDGVQESRFAETG